MTTTVTVDLTEFDRLRENEKKYKKLCNGIDGYTDWLEVQSTETHVPMQDFARSLARYNNLKPIPKHPFLIANK